MKIEEKIEEKEYCVLQSSKRNTESLNRFNYKISFSKTKLTIRTISKISITLSLFKSP